jgi:hypothetical protein
MFPDRAGNERRKKTVTGKNRMTRIEVLGMDCGNCRQLVSNMDTSGRYDEDQVGPYSGAHKMGATPQFSACIGRSLSGR